jgi:hypothetical protein
MLACGGGQKSSSHTSLSQKDLAAQDVASFDSMDASPLRTYDNANGNLITKLFGAATGSSVHTYLNRRIHYYFNSQELNTLVTSPSSLPNQQMFSAVIRRPASAHGPADDDGVIEVAANVGTLLWYLGLTNSTSVTATIANKVIPVTSSRVGIMHLGDGYVKALQLSDGTIMKIPLAYRQATLVHEARHSDCTGGLTQADVTALTGYTSYTQTAQNFKLECGHLHSICVGGDYDGVSACDDRDWGAYAVGTVFLESVMSTYSGSELEVLQADYADLLTRFQNDYDQMKTAANPDMTSDGVSP